MDIEQLKSRLRIPAMVSPLFLGSGPDMVVESCKAGLIGTFPELNQRTVEGFEQWLKEIRQRLDGRDCAPFGAQFTPHETNPRFKPDLEAAIRYELPIVITTIRITREVTDAVHAYGGLVFHDATTIRHAQKAVEANVDAVIAVTHGAGGHSGSYNPFAFVAELRTILQDKALILAGGISDGRSVAGAIAAGADLVSMGTCFVPTVECMTSQGHKQMILDSNITDIIYTDEVSGMGASFLGQTLKKFTAPESSGRSLDVMKEITPKIWRDYWSAGQGVGGSTEILTVRALAERLEREYTAAIQRAGSIARKHAGNRDTIFGTRADPDRLAS
jgi:nitronate monooxygenase